MLQYYISYFMMNKSTSVFLKMMFAVVSTFKCNKVLLYEGLQGLTVNQSASWYV